MSAGVAGVLPPPVVYREKAEWHHVRATRTRTHTHTWTYPPTENTRNTRKELGSSCTQIPEGDRDPELCVVSGYCNTLNK